VTETSRFGRPPTANSPVRIMSIGSRCRRATTATQPGQVRALSRRTGIGKCQ
jgi:hypothetical protein